MQKIRELYPLCILGLSNGFHDMEWSMQNHSKSDVTSSPAHISVAGNILTYTSQHLFLQNTQSE